LKRHADFTDTAKEPWIPNRRQKMGRPPTVYFLQFQYSRAGTISTSCNVLSPEQGIKEANIRFIFFLQVAKSGYSRDRFIQNPPHGGHPCLWL